MNTNTPRLFLTYLIVASFIMGSPLVVASPVVEPPTTIPSIYGDCEVQDITWKYDDESYRIVDEDVYGSEEYATILRCEVGLRRFEGLVLHEEPDRIRIDIYLDRDFKNFYKAPSTKAPSLIGSITEEKSDFLSEGVRQVIVNGEIEFRFSEAKQVDVKISSKETYQPNDILNDLAENGELKFEFETNAHTHEKTVKFDGVSNAAKEFLRRVKSLRETNNEDR